MLGETEAPPPGDDGTAASALGAEEKGTHRALPYPATLVFSSGYGSLRPSRHQCTPCRASGSPAHVKLYTIQRALSGRMRISLSSVDAEIHSARLPSTCERLGLLPLPPEDHATLMIGQAINVGPVAF